MLEYFKLELTIICVDFVDKRDRGSISYDIAQMNDRFYQQLIMNNLLQLKLKLIQNGFSREVVVEEIKPGITFYLSFGNQECVEGILKDFLSMKLKNQFQEALITAFEVENHIKVEFCLKMDIEELRNYFVEFKESNEFIFSENMKYRKTLSEIVKYQNILNSSISVFLEDLVLYDQNAIMIPSMLETLKAGNLLENVVYKLKEGSGKHRKLKKCIKIMLDCIHQITMIYQNVEYFIASLSQINQNYEDTTQMKEKYKIYKIYDYMSLLVSSKAPLKDLDCNDWVAKTLIKNRDTSMGVVAFVPKMVELFKELDELTDQYVNPWKSKINKM